MSYLVTRAIMLQNQRIKNDRSMIFKSLGKPSDELLCMRKNEGISEEIMFQEDENRGALTCNVKLLGKFEDEGASQCVLHECF